MNQDRKTRKRGPLRPRDPAIWVWAAVALMALVPLQHAVASRADHTAPVGHAQPASPVAAQPAGEGTATP